MFRVILGVAVYNGRKLLLAPKSPKWGLAFQIKKQILFQVPELVEEL